MKSRTTGSYVALALAAAGTLLLACSRSTAVESAYPLGEEKTLEVRGRDIVAGLPKTLTITSEEIRDALKDTVSLIVDAVRSTLDRCEPELAADLVDRGLVL